MTFSNNEQPGKQEILAYLDRYGIQNKDLNTGKPRKKADPTLQKKKKTLRKTIDLHGKIEQEAVLVLRKTFMECKRRGVDELLIIHGIGYNSTVSGGPVLKKVVRDMLDNEFCLAIKDYRTAIPKDGGDGATLVSLRR